MKRFITFSFLTIMLFTLTLSSCKDVFETSLYDLNKQRLTSTNWYFYNSCSSPYLSFKNPNVYSTSDGTGKGTWELSPDGKSLEMDLNTGKEIWHIMSITSTEFKLTVPGNAYILYGSFCK